MSINDGRVKSSEEKLKRRPNKRMPGIVQLEWRRRRKSSCELKAVDNNNNNNGEENRQRMTTKKKKQLVNLYAQCIICRFSFSLRSLPDTLVSYSWFITRLHLTTCEQREERTRAVANDGDVALCETSPISSSKTWLTLLLEDLYREQISVGSARLRNVRHLLRAEQTKFYCSQERIDVQLMKITKAIYYTEHSEILVLVASRLSNWFSPNVRCHPV